MGRRDRDHEGRQGPAMDRPSTLSPGTMRFLTLSGVAILIFMTATIWSEVRHLQSGLNDRLNRMDTRLTALTTKVESAVGKAAQPARQGPDPNRVYAVNVEKAPYKGPKAAPVTIVEFSDFQ
ncbi:MAG TPA: hypothetical protein VFT43_07395 [Candidatus Polarisedimenticolia bacterium]|nr:hypothetical protein [Candidatus Polarisedimenticolia bacterium]